MLQDFNKTLRKGGGMNMFVGGLVYILSGTGRDNVGRVCGLGGGLSGG
jgi:hypothetical protein